MGNAGKADSFEKNASLPRVSLFDDIEVDGIGVVFEDLARDEGFRLIAGVDEVGRGCIAGPVVAAACILDPDRKLPEGLDDSKKLTPELRTEIALRLKDECIGFAIGQIEADRIDNINILEATKEAMLMAISSLAPSPDYLLIDALQLKACPLPQKGIIKGDSISASIAAASILAKTFRDELMTEYDRVFPPYGFAAHKGYGCATHYQAIRDYGPCPIHRMSFRGVADDETLATTLF